ncbi:calcium/sodium antiporter [Pararhodobacter sp.]|uniref:calcium/sodium antiporter n=1 Tax=Pararhodobacter sp. TaxID=2127056 RepID=UPI002AFFF474|nr:calcium/sodium antiporter [Pararhodobacter sp.]
MDYLFILAGLALLIAGGEAVVRGASSLASKLGLSPVLIGLTVVGFGTSMPELMVSLDAALGGSPDIALGNVVGSNIANILLILGVTALIWPIQTATLSLGRALWLVMVATLALIVPFAMGSIGLGFGVAFLGVLTLYLVLAFRETTELEGADAGIAPLNIWISTGLILGGLVGLMVGANALVSGATALARLWGLSEAYIGLTIVAVGTSLPELATSLVAALRRQPGIAVGNVVGSNIFNILGILGVTAVVTPIPVTSRFLTFDLPVMLAATVAMLLALRLPRIGRSVGLVFLLGYAVYLWAAQG